MSGIEVAATVASILAAFGSGMDMFKRMRAKQKARKQDKQGAKLTREELRLRQSLSRGPQQIRAEYDRNVVRLGHRFKVGDTTAQASLAQTLVVLNAGLINILHHALSEDSKAREMSKRSLLGLSELAAADTLNILGQLNQRLSCVPNLSIQTHPQHRTPHRRKGKPLKEKDQTSSVLKISPAETKEKKKRPGPDPLARGGWVRSKSGTSVVSSSSSTPRPPKQASNHLSFSPSIDSSLRQPEPVRRSPRLAQSSPQCTCEAHVPAPRHNLETNEHQTRLNVPPQIQELDLLLASPHVFADSLPPRPPKIAIERPAPNRNPRPPSVATFLTASTKIGEIPEHRWLDRPALPWENRPLPYVIPPPLEPEPAKRKTRGFKSWWKSHGRDEEDARKDVQMPVT
jgi:hypothetical protein